MHHVYTASTESGDIYVLKMDSKGKWVEEKSLLDDIPDWVKMSDHECTDCKIILDSEKPCSAALGVYCIAHSFLDVPSIKTISLTEITSDNRITTQNMQADSGLTAIFLDALIFSKCSRFKEFGWAWEYYKTTVSDVGLFYNFFSSYLMKKFLQGMSASKEITISRFILEFEEMRNTLLQFVHTLRVVAKNDANINALVSIISMTQLFETDPSHYLTMLNDMMEEAS